MNIPISGLLLEGCVLSLLSKEDAYGYSLTQQVKNDLAVSESTLYPVMRRLQTEESLTVYDVPHNGRNRRYYKLTDKGQLKFLEVQVHWQAFKNRIDRILLHKGEHHGN